MAEPLRVLMVEDSPDDAALIVREIRRAGFEPQPTRVETAATLRDALAHGPWDIVISDYSLPSFSGIEALHVVQEHGLDLPFIIASGAISEETAVAAMRAGAHDYVLKDKLARLGPAISRELREARLRAERRHVAGELARVREESAAALRKSRDQLEVVLRGIAEGVVAEDAEGQVVYVNEIASRQRISPLESKESLVRRMVADYELRDEQGKLLRFEDLPLPRAHATGQRVEMMIWSLHRPTGEERWYINTSTPIFDEQGRLAMVISIYRDLSAQKRVEEDARYLADATKAFATAALDMPALLTAIAKASVPRLADWCAVEVSEDEAFEQPQIAVAHRDPQKENAVRRLTRDHLRAFEALAGSPGANDEVRRILSAQEQADCCEGDADAQALVTELSPRTIFTLPLVAQEETFGRLTLIRTHQGPELASDLELAREMARRAALLLENARLYRRTRVAVAARDEFLSIASHELRTPLTALLLQIQRLKKLIALPRPGSIAAAEVTIDHALRQMHRLTSLIETLLDISRAAVGRLVPDPERVDLSELVRAVVDRSVEEAAEARSTIHITATEPVPGEWNRVRLEQVVTNLLSNALKYGGGKPIEISISGDATEAHLSIRDHGIGIAAKDLPRIFQRFERAVSPWHYGGLGLGLFITKRIVEAHNGTIEVQSKPGQGSTFTVHLPRQRPTAEAPGNSPTIAN